MSTTPCLKCGSLYHFTAAHDQAVADLRRAVGWSAVPNALAPEEKAGVEMEAEAAILRGDPTMPMDPQFILRLLRLVDATTPEVPHG